MASTKEYYDFVLDQLSLLDGISSRKMMGKYILYYKVKYSAESMMIDS